MVDNLPDMVVIPSAAFPWMEAMTQEYVAGCEAHNFHPRSHRWQSAREPVCPHWYGMIHRLADHIATAADHGFFRAIYGLANTLPRRTRRMGRHQRNKLRRIAGVTGAG